MRIFIIYIMSLFLLTSCGNQDSVGTLNGTGSHNASGSLKGKGINNNLNNKNINSFDGKEVEKLITSGDYKKAGEILNEEYNKNKNDVSVLRLLSKLKLTEKKGEEALKYILEANKIANWKDKQLLYELSICYSNLGKLDESEKYINNALSIDPNYSFAKAYLKVIKRSKNRINNLNNKNINSFDGKEVEKLITSGDYKKAGEILNEEYNKNKNDISVLRLLSKLKLTEKKNEEALKYILEANKIANWKDKQLLYELSICYSNLGKLDESEKYINNALSIDPNYSFAKAYLKVIEKAKNDIKSKN